MWYARRRHYGRPLLIAAPQIVYADSSSGGAGVSSHGQLYTVNPDGSSLLRLTSTAGGGSSPSWFWAAPRWSPDRSQIAAILVLQTGGTSTTDPTLGLGGEGLFVMNPDGSGMRQITNLGAHARLRSGALAWSPDGTQLATAWNDGTNAGIEKINADNSGYADLVLGAAAFTVIESGDSAGAIVWTTAGFAFNAENSVSFLSGVATCAADGSGLTAILSDPTGADQYFLLDVYEDRDHLLVVEELPVPNYLLKVDLSGTVVDLIYDDATNTYLGLTTFGAISIDESLIAVQSSTPTSQLFAATASPPPTAIPGVSAAWLNWRTPS